MEISGNREDAIMMKKISRRSFLQASGVAAAMAALTACGGSRTETAKKDDAHEAITFMAPYKEVEAFIEQVHSVYPEVNIEIVPYSGDTPPPVCKICLRRATCRTSAP